MLLNAIDEASKGRRNFAGSVVSRATDEENMSYGSEERLTQSGDMEMAEPMDEAC